MRLKLNISGPLLLLLIFVSNLSAQDSIKQIPIFLCGLDPIEGTTTADGRQAYGIFKGKFFYEDEKPPVGETHSWLLYVESAEGEVLEGATIQGDGINYDAMRGFSKPPVISEYVGNGHYRVEGIHFQVGGVWTMRFQVIWEGKADVLSFFVEI